jgi:hypothetical protein
MNTPKITTGKLTLTLHADVIMDHYDQYDGPLTEGVARVIKAYGGNPDPSCDFFGLAEEDSILVHNETSALLIVGLLDHPYAAEELEGDITIVTTSYPEDEDIMGELECIGGMDANLVVYNPPSFGGDGAEVILNGKVTLEALDDIMALGWVSEVTVL